MTERRKQKLIRALALFLCAALLLPAGGLAGAESGAGELSRDAWLHTAGESAGGADGSPVLRISELMHKNRAVLRDEDGDFSDWIELENASDRPLDLGGWSLSDGKNKERWTLPARTLNPGELLLVFADGKDRAAAELHADFSLSEGETLCLWSPEGLAADTAFCEGNTADRALVRQEDGSFSESLFPTPGYANSDRGYDSWQESLPAPAPLRISEVAVFDLEYRFSAGYENCDWVELKNVSEEPIALEGWTLSDTDDDLGRWSFPARTIRPGECLKIRCSEQPGLADDWKDLCTGFKLSADAEQLFLSSPDGTLIDWAALRGIPWYGSYGRIDGENGWFYFSVPSPGKDNAEGCRRVSRAPTTQTRDGVYENTESVTVALEGEGTIYYTTDGSLPKPGGQVLDGPLTLEKTTVLRAVAVQDGALPSPALTLSFFLNEGHVLPVMSLVTDSPREYRYVYDNMYSAIELPGALSFYEEDGGFTIPCGIRLNGQTSLVLWKKNYSVRFRSAYGASSLDYDCFGGGVTSFTNLLLRSGQDYAAYLMRNELGCLMAARATDRILVQRFQYGVLYINGVYSGIYALMEKSNEQMFADHYGVSRESVTVEESSVHENTRMYREVFLPLFSTDMAVDENYRAVCEHLDIDSFIDWIIVEGWCANKDLTYGNLRYGSSSENDGKWRLMLYDLDATFSEPYLCFDLMASHAIATRQTGAMIAALLRNEEFRSKLLSRAAELLEGPLSNEALVAGIDELAAVLDPEVERNHQMLGMEKKAWLRNVEKLKARVLEEDWQQHCIDMLCSYAHATEEERARYFGETG